MVEMISSKVAYEQLIRNARGVRDSLEVKGREISSGKVDDLVGKDPILGRQAYALRATSTDAQAEIDAAKKVQTRTDATQNALESIREQALTVRDRALAAPRQSTIGFGQLAQKAESAIKQVVSIGNTEVAGRHLFGGTETKNNPLGIFGSEGDPTTSAGLVSDRLSTMLSGGGPAPAITSVDNRGDALAVTAQSAVQIEANPGASLYAENEIKLAGSDRVVGEVVVDKAPNGEDRVTMAFDRSYAPQAGEQIEVEINGQTVTSAALGATPNAQDAATALDNAVSAAASGPLNAELDAATSSVSYDGLDAVFRDSLSGAGDAYSDTVYQGASGPNGDVQTKVNGVDVEYGARADSNAFRDVLEGMHMLSAIDKDGRPAGISREGVNAMRDLAIERISAGVDALGEEQGRVGVAQEELETQIDALGDKKAVADKAVADIENVDQVEAISKLQDLQTQLQASFQATARIGRLSLANYL